MNRGDVYFVELNSAIGCEQSGTRPAVIIQNNTGNKHSPTVIVSLITSQMKPKLPTHVRACGRDKLSKASIIMAEQIRTIDKHRLRKFICSLCDETMERLDKALKVSLEIRTDTKKEGDEQMGNLMTFNNEEIGIGVRTILNEDGSISVNAEDTAIGFGWCRTEIKNGKEYRSVRWATINGYCKEFGFANSLAKDDYIPESLFYRLGMKANNQAAERFQSWLAADVIPSIRKTGGYQYKKMTPEEMMRVQLGMLDGHEERLTKLENTMNIDYGQQRVLEKEVGKTVIEALDGKDSLAYKELSKKVFAECNHDVKDYFNVNSRNNIPRARFDDAVEYIREWKPCTNTQIIIRECNKQIS